jgi:hypothetical protein
MPWKIGENIIAGQVSATPKQDPGVSRYTKPMPRNGLESINSGASSCRYKYPRELMLIFPGRTEIDYPHVCLKPVSIILGLHMDTGEFKPAPSPRKSRTFQIPLNIYV